MYEYISSGYDKLLNSIKFKLVKIQNHLRYKHKDVILCITKTSVDIKKESIELIVKKK